MNKQDLRDIWQYVMLIAPAPIGALIGMRYAVDQTPKARAYTGPCSMGLAPSWRRATMSGQDLGLILMAAAGRGARHWI